MYGFYLKEKNTGQQEKDRMGKHWGRNMTRPKLPRVLICTQTHLSLD